MIARIFLAVGTFLLLLALITQNPIPFLNKKVASKQKNNNKSFMKGRWMELKKPLDGQIPSDKQSIIMNDPQIYKKWGLEKSNALDAWQLTTGSRDIVVAVVDTGVDPRHPDLTNNLWRNPGETGKDKKGRNKATNGVDDDRNGFIDDVHGWNFVHNNSYLVDNHGHGTHIAGIIGAEGGNNVGVVGVAPKVSLMILKYFDPNSPGNNLVNTIKAFNYAIQMKAHIINYSGGGLEYSHPEFQAVKRAEKVGILFVSAAGNEHTNSDFNSYYPADYKLDNIISVTAIDPGLQVLSSSNYGVRTVDIAAPGENIYSTVPGGGIRRMTGTSQATAFVSGVAALLMAHNRDFDAKTVRQYIFRTGDRLEQLKSKTKTSRKLNVFRALSMLDQGVGVSGVMARNTSNPESNEFNTPGDKKGKTSLSHFGRSLKKALNKKKKNK